MHFAKHTLFRHTEYAKLVYFEPLVYFETLVYFEPVMYFDPDLLASTLANTMQSPFRFQSSFSQ